MTVSIEQENINYLKEAIRNGDFKLAEKIIEDNNIDPNLSIDNGNSMFQFALQTEIINHEELNNFLINMHNKGMDLDDSSENPEYIPVLFTAIDTNNKDLVKLLLNTNDYDKTNAVIALQLSCEENVNMKTFLPVFSKFAEYVDEKNMYGNSIIAEVAAKSYSGVENKLFSLLRASEDKESINFKGQSSLFQAVESGTAYTAKILLSIGINVNHVDSYNRNALFRVDGDSEKEVKDKLTYLIEAGIDINQLNKSKKTAFDVNDKITSLKDWAIELSQKTKNEFESSLTEGAKRKMNFAR